MKRTSLFFLLLMATLQLSAQLCLNGVPLPYDKLTNTFLASVPESDFSKGNKFTVTSVEPDLQVYFTHQPNNDGNLFVFSDISEGKSYSLQLRRKNKVMLSAHLQFTFLPILQLQGDFGYDYQPGTLLLYEPNKASIDTLLSTIKWRGGITNTDDKHKRNYKIKLNNDKSLLGMRNDNNWILDAGQADVFRLRNRVAMDIWNDMATPPYYIDREPNAHSGVKGQLVEVFLNDQYMGFYNFSENMDRKQMKVKKVDKQTGHIRGCLYKAKQWEYALMYDTLYIPADNLSEQWNAFEVKYPDLADNDTTDWSTLYNAIDFVVMSSDLEFADHVAEYFDIPPLVDYCVFGSSLNALDNYGKNIFWAVYDKNEDKRLTLGAWDLDCTVGQPWAARYNVDFTSPYLLFDMSFGLTRRLITLNVDNFNEKVNQRYKELRTSILSNQALKQRYHDYYDIIVSSGAANRETLRWSRDSDIDFEPIDFKYEMENIDRWITTHMNLLDRHEFPISIDISGIANQPTVNTGKINSVYDLSGRRLNGKSLSKGIYIINGKKVVK